MCSIRDHNMWTQKKQGLSIDSTQTISDSWRGWGVYQSLCFWGRDSSTPIFDCVQQGASPFLTPVLFKGIPTCLRTHAGQSAHNSRRGAENDTRWVWPWCHSNCTWWCRPKDELQVFRPTGWAGVGEAFWERTAVEEGGVRQRPGSTCWRDRRVGGDSGAALSLLEERFLLRFCLRKGTWTRVGAAVKHSRWQTKYFWGRTDRFSNQIWWQAVRRRSRNVSEIPPIQVPAVSRCGDRGAVWDRRPWRKWASGMLMSEGPKHKRDAWHSESSILARSDLNTQRFLLLFCVCVCVCVCVCMCVYFNFYVITQFPVCVCVCVCILTSMLSLSILPSRLWAPQTP